jgi:hypothetical protein
MNELALRVVIDPNCVAGYNRVFRLLLMTHRAGAALAVATRTMSERGRASERGVDPNAAAVLMARRRAVSVFRHDMQHCVGVLREFFSRQVLEVGSLFVNLVAFFSWPALFYSFSFRRHLCIPLFS